MEKSCLTYSSCTVIGNKRVYPIWVSLLYMIVWGPINKQNGFRFYTSPYHKMVMSMTYVQLIEG